MHHLILAVNPGSTSTKIGLFSDNEPIFTETVEHEHKDLEQYPSIVSQRQMRSRIAEELLMKHEISPSMLSAAVGRGGLLPPLKTGGYLVNDKMIDMIVNEKGVSPHASNLGALIAYDIAGKAKVQAFIYDAVSASDICPVAQITGFPEIKRNSFSHVLNCRANAIAYAKSLGRAYEDMNLIVAHLGGGVSVTAHQKGEIIDTVGDDFGCFSPERSGSAPLLDFIELCYSGAFTKKEMQKKVRGQGGLKAYFDTPDVRTIEKMALEGNKKAELILNAMCYTIGKSIGSLAPTLKGKCDAVILTGGIARSKFITDKIAEMVSFIGKVVIMPGEYELEALAAGALRIIKGEEKVNIL